MSGAAPAGWVAVRTCLSPKQGGGWVDLYWSAPHRRRTWGPLCEDTLLFGTMAALEAALVETWGPDWRTSRWHEPVRLELLHDQPALY